ncbi:HAMP domain-containing sensor histidine kinase [Peptostreptococcaceae bacterium AGR-M142]
MLKNKPLNTFKKDLNSELRLNSIILFLGVVFIFFLSFYFSLFIFEKNHLNLNHDILKDFFKILFPSFILLLSLILFIYFKNTSKNLLKPIKIIIAFLENVKKGNYNFKINNDFNEDFNIIKNSLNDLQFKLEREIKLRKKADEHRRNFILNISHDLKTPFTNILGYIEIIKYHDDIDLNTKNKYIDIIISNINKSNKLLLDLNDLTKMQSKDYTYLFKRSEINELLREIIIQYIPQFEKQNINYNVLITHNTVYSMIDQKNFSKAISNMLENIIKHSECFNMDIQLDLKNEKNYQIIIKDDGIGIDESYSNEIFEPFTKVDFSRNSKIDGSGLGLSISNSIINRHGGLLYLDKTINNGCKFIIDMPILNYNDPILKKL